MTHPLVKLLGKSLDIHAKGVKIRADLIQRFWGDKAVGHVVGQKTTLLGQLCAIQSILKPDGGLVVGPGDTFAVARSGRLRRVPGTQVLDFAIIQVSPGVSNVPVLTAGTTEVAPYGSQRQPGTSRVKVKQRLLLDGRDHGAGDPGVDQRVKLTFPVDSSVAVSEPIRLYIASSLTDIAPDFAIGEPVVKQCLFELAGHRHSLPSEGGLPPSIPIRTHCRRSNVYHPACLALLTIIHNPTSE